MQPTHKLKLIIYYNNAELHCVVIQNERTYQLLLNDIDVATIQLNQSEKWVQLKGLHLPEMFINEIGSHIEARHRQALFAEN